MIHVIVAYATPKKQIEIPLNVEENCSVALAIQRSGILQLFPDIKLAEARVGIYSKKVALDDGLRDGDRIEIYRSLKIDPKQARLLRAKRNKDR
ncbi:RnfH family protein [Candidiatus Paracoxiella cheracis]|uniref:RnfH family protein n=1 Tax=Candidiatus Paracoxiella cheracis TaxID=3405120 RepID=UPI003BF4C862